MSNKLLITKEQFIDSIIPFVDKYKRLPFMDEDDIIVPIENNKKIEYRPYRAKRYIENFYDTQENLVKYLFDNEILTYEYISDITNLSLCTVKGLIKNTIKNPSDKDRRKLHIFFNRDLYEDKLRKWAERCEDCSRRVCKNDYWVTVVGCPNFKNKKK